MREREASSAAAAAHEAAFSRRALQPRSKALACGHVPLPLLHPPALGGTGERRRSGGPLTESVGWKEEGVVVVVVGQVEMKE